MFAEAGWLKLYNSKEIFTSRVGKYMRITKLVSITLLALLFSIVFLSCKTNKMKYEFVNGCKRFKESGFITLIDKVPYAVIPSTPILLENGDVLFPSDNTEPYSYLLNTCDYELKKVPTEAIFVKTENQERYINGKKVLSTPTDPSVDYIGPVHRDFMHETLVKNTSENYGQDFALSGIENSKWVLTGGTDNREFLSRVLLIDQAQKRLTYLKEMANPRSMHRQIVISSNELLIAGGFDNKGPIKNLEIYNIKNQVTNLYNLNNKYYNHGMARLNNLEVLIFGGKSKSEDCAQGKAEIFNLKTHTSKAIDSMIVPRFNFNVIRLLNGSILISGGVHCLGADKSPVESIEIYVPNSR